MSFDVFFMPLVDGDAGSGGGDAVRRVLAPYLRPSEDDPQQMLLPDGSSSDIYLHADSMSVCHTQPAVWPVLIEAARAGGWAVMPAGGPWCVFDAAMIRHLPPGFEHDARVIHSADDFMRAIHER